MLGTLQSDMSKHGISTIPKGDCAACGKTIIGQVVIALGKMWYNSVFDYF
jgi:paxillin